MGDILTSIVRPLLMKVHSIALLIGIHTIFSFRVRNSKHTSLPTGKKFVKKIETGGKGHWSIIGNVVSIGGAKYVRVTSTRQRNECMYIQTCRI